MIQMSIYDLLDEPQHVYVLSPGELAAQGIAWTQEQARQWEEQVWKVYHRERERTGAFINWFEAIEIYIAERDSQHTRKVG